MVRKYSVLLGIIISAVLLLISTWYYPGGSQFDKNSVGYDWKNNYLSNLFSIKAMNGSDNASRPWAVVGMFFLCVSFALFFSRFSNKIPLRGAARIIKYAGVASMLFAFLSVTAYHDIMVTIANILALISLFYIAVFIFKSSLMFLKIISIVCILILYGCSYIYYTGHCLEFLPIMQKLGFGFCVIWFLCLEYLTKPADFQFQKKMKTIDKEDTSINR